MRFFSHHTPIYICGLVLVLISSTAFGQVVINEIVTDEREAGSGQITDTREYIELYNAGGSAVDIGNWTVDSIVLVDGSFFTSDPIPASTTLASGDYYVIGQSGVPNLDLDLGTSESWVNINAVYELRDSGASLVDALAVTTAFDPNLDNVTAEQLTQIGNGVWGQTLSANTSFPQSLSRYVDGRDTNVNGYDFGYIPLTPGTSNNLPQIGAFTPPDVDALGTGSDVPGFGGSFVLPKVIDPTVADVNNPNAIPASPQGGKAIIAWDSSGGGNMDNSNSLVTSFDLYAYLDTQTLGVSASSTEWESTIYGLGTTDPFFAFPAPSNTLTDLLPSPSTDNGSTGIGWVYQRIEDDNPFFPVDAALLMLVDFHDGGDSVPGTDWTVIQTFDMSGEASAWHRLGIDFDPNTGEVTARLDDQTFNFTTSTDLIGTFYAGYRENLTDSPVPSVARPPTFDLVEVATIDGDFDNDGDVDGDDFLVWQLTDGTPAGLTAWQNNYGSPLSAVASVPEPSSFVLLTLGVALGWRRRHG